jgi:4-amino-4-deoxy-L-arabinose transferase-like glycosyltransferase
VGLLFLLLWTTKWPHYVLILTAPLCLAAAEGTQRLLALPARALRARRGVA